MSSHALLIGISRFTDPKLDRLNAPRSDVEAFARVLKDPERGGFTSVTTCIDQELQVIRDQLASLLLHERNPDDLVLVYYSGHGIITRGQRLFLATQQSQFDYPQAASLSAAEIKDWLEQSRAGKQVVILDCCHSGAFGEGPKGAVQTVNPDTFGDGEGQYILTATDALQFAYDSSGTLKEGSASSALSRFTGWLVDAIGNGEAAPDSGFITLDAVFNYLSHRARIEAAGMTPKRFVKRNSGEMVIARNPLAMPATLPEEIISGLDAKDREIQRDAVIKLGSFASQPRYRDLVIERLLKLASDAPAGPNSTGPSAPGLAHESAPAGDDLAGQPSLPRHDAPPPVQTSSQREATSVEEANGLANTAVTAPPSDPVHDAPLSDQTPIQHLATKVGGENRLSNVAVTESVSGAGLGTPSVALSISAVLLAVPILPVLYPTVGIMTLVYGAALYFWAQDTDSLTSVGSLWFLGVAGVLFFAIALAVLHRELKFAETHPLYAKIRHWIRLTIIAGGTYYWDQTGSPGEAAILAIVLAVATHFVLRYAATRRAWSDIVETAWTAIKDKEKPAPAERRNNTNL